MEDLLDVCITPGYIDGEFGVNLGISFTEEGPAYSLPTRPSVNLEETVEALDINFPSNVAKDIVNSHFADELLYQTQPKEVPLTREEELMKLVSAFETQVDVLSK